MNFLERDEAEGQAIRAREAEAMLPPAGSHRDGVTTALIFLFLGTVLGVGLIAANASQPVEDRSSILDMVGYGAILLGVLAIWVTAVTHLAACADYLKQIAAQQATIIAKRQSGAPPVAPASARGPAKTDR